MQGEEMDKEPDWKNWLREWSSTIYPEDEALLRSIESGSGVLDGVMSPLTKAMVKSYGCTGVDMDTLWAFTPTSWKCPSCQRSKVEIARPNKNGDLMCRLVEHHDHMKDLLLRKFQSISANMERVLADEAAEGFAKRSAPMVSAYDNTVICNDCNNADAAAKKHVRAHASFSFSPQEILEFVITVPGAEHRIDRAIAARIWEQNRSTFELRMKIVERIAEIAAKNEHWYQSMPVQAHPSFVKKVAANVAGNWRAPHALSVLCGPTRQQPQKGLSDWRRKPVQDGPKVPTSGEIEHVAKVTSKKKWDLVPDDWHCPACNRSKIQIVRPTKQSAWAFPIARKLYRDVASESGSTTHTVCDDCGNAAIAIVKEAVRIADVEVEAYARQVGLRELAEIVRARPHGSHRFDNDGADALVIKLVERLSYEE
jgi:rubredoxin